MDRICRKRITDKQYGFRICELHITGFKKRLLRIFPMRLSWKLENIGNMKILGVKQDKHKVDGKLLERTKNENNSQQLKAVLENNKRSHKTQYFLTKIKIVNTYKINEIYKWEIKFNICKSHMMEIGRNERRLQLTYKIGN